MKGTSLIRLSLITYQDAGMLIMLSGRHRDCTLFLAMPLDFSSLHLHVPAGNKCFALLLSNICP